MTVEEKSKPTAAPPEPKRSAEEVVEIETRAMEAKDALMGMMFAAMKLRGRELRAREGSLPLTIIGGFLGSGKTTLLNHLLLSPHGLRLVVLVNDFGQINIDADLITSQTDDMINLTNGCACCAVSADLTNSLIKIAEREAPPDAIVLEASGIAEPNGIIQVALTNPSIRLDGSIVVVDAETMQTLVEDRLTRRLFENQIYSADLIVLSKVDLLGDEQRADAIKWLKTRYPEKRVIEAVNGNVPTDILLSIETKRDLKAEAPEKTDHVFDFESVSFTVDEPLDGDLLRDFLETLPPSLLRAKGILQLAEKPDRRTIYQRVGARWDYQTAEPWGAEPPHSNLVLIGPKGVLNRSALEKQLRACITDKKT